MTTENRPTLISTGEATAILPAGNVSPITVIGTEAIRATFDDQTLAASDPFAAGPRA